MRVIKGDLLLAVKAEDNSNDVIQLSGLQPPKNFLKEKNQQKRPVAKTLINIGGNKAVDIDAKPSPKIVEDDIEWEEARISNVSSFEMNENIKKARQERIKSTYNRPCVTTLQQDSQRETSESNNSDEEELLNDTSVSNLHQIHMNRDLKKKEERGQRIDKRALRPVEGLDGEQEEVEFCGSIDDEIDIEEEQSGEDNGEDGGWKDCQNATELQATARRLLNHCEKIGRNLRRRLSEWGERIIDEANGETSFCTDLLNIRNLKDDAELLNDKSFETICPGLVLKEYQLVGVNWLKLLHENATNGVLADDMVQNFRFLCSLSFKLSVPSYY
jgi:hypothetical protein